MVFESLISMWGAKITYLLGFTNIIFLLLVASTCRCVLSSGFFQKLWQKEGYKKFYSHHCWYWRAFLASVVLHGIFALLSFGVPSFP